MHNLPGTPREQRAAYVAMVLSEPPVNEPGSKFLYSNRNYAVAGAIAEKTANDSWESLMQKRIFKPLGMQTCGFGAMGTPGITDPKEITTIDQPWQHMVLTLGVHKPIEPGPLADNPPVDRSRRHSALFRGRLGKIYHRASSRRAGREGNSEARDVQAPAHSTVRRRLRLWMARRGPLHGPADAPSITPAATRKISRSCGWRPPKILPC